MNTRRNLLRGPGRGGPGGGKEPGNALHLKNAEFRAYSVIGRGEGERGGVFSSDFLTCV